MIRGMKKNILGNIFVVTVANGAIPSQNPLATARAHHRDLASDLPEH